MGSDVKHYAFPRRRGNNITLIGMPSSGKSTLGKLAAKLLKREFLDTDNVLAERTGRKNTAALAKELSFSGFVREESAAILSVQTENTIIATGGSVIYSPRAMRHLQKLGPIIYIQQSLEKIEARVNNNPNRGVILKKGQTFEDLYEARHILYRRYADLEMIPEELDVRTSARLLVALITYMEAEKERLYGQKKNRSH